MIKLRIVKLEKLLKTLLKKQPQVIFLTEAEYLALTKKEMDQLNQSENILFIDDM